MRINTDILIVGAGPAGLAAAIEASKGEEVDVLIVEKEGRLAVKPCAEAVSAATLEDIGAPKDSKIVRNPIRGARIHAPNDRLFIEIRGKMGEGYIINKKRLLEWMAKKAVSQGARIMISSPVLDFKIGPKGFVSEVIIAKRGTLIRAYPKVVIACDGIGSLFARKFFNRRGYRLISTAQYVMGNVEKEDRHVIDIWVGRKVAPGGYLWLFPRGNDEVCVGAGTRGALARKCLDAFLERKHAMFVKAVELEYSIGAVPISGQIPKRVKGNVMLCGDAAGQVIPLTGGGIHSASAAGFIAGKVAREAVAYGEVSERLLKEYEKEYDKSWGMRIKRSLRALKVIEGLNDEELNELAKILEPEDVIALANGLEIRKVAQKLMKHPIFALKIARTLIG